MNWKRSLVSLLWAHLALAFGYAGQGLLIGMLFGQGLWLFIPAMLCAAAGWGIIIKVLMPRIAEDNETGGR